MKKLVLISVLAGLGVTCVLSQVVQQRMEGNFPPGENVMGKVTAINGNSLTVAPLTGGNPVTVKVGDNTRVIKERQPAKLGDIKVDETVFARGQRNGDSMDAAMLSVVNPEMIQRLQQGGPAGQQFNPQDLGKKFIAGEVKAINETKLTIARPDSQSQDIEVDENTSFKKGNESITLADIKVGDFVRGTGELKNGTFVPKELVVGRPRMMTFGPGGGPGDQKKPDSDKPAPPKN